MEQDRRYRVLVSLVRADRPRYWTWHCPNCQKAIAELSNTDVVGMTDFADMNNQENALVGVRCHGRLQSGMGYCNFWYYFNLNDRPTREKR